MGLPRTFRGGVVFGAVVYCNRVPSLLRWRLCACVYVSRSVVLWEVARLGGFGMYYRLNPGGWGVGCMLYFVLGMAMNEGKWRQLVCFCARFVFICVLLFKRG